MPNLLLLERKAFTSLRRCFWLLPIATLTFVCQAAAGQQQLIDQSPDTGDAWAESRIAGAQAGYYHEQSTTTPGGKIATVIENDVVLNRLHNKVEMKSTAEYQETGNGQLFSVASSVSSSAQSIKTDARVEGSELVVRTSTGGKEYERRVPFTGVIVGPAGGRQLAARCLKNVGDTVSYQTFSPELGTMITIADAMIAKETITVEGIPTAAIKLEQTNSAMPGKSVVWLNADGWILRQVSPSPFGEMEMMRASAENAQRRDIHGATLPKESFAQTLVGSNIRLPEERLIERLTIRITHKKPELGWPELNADNQRVVEQTADHVVLEIRQARPVADGARPVQTSDPKMLQYLQPNAILQSDDATVRSIAAHVVGNETTHIMRSANSKSGRIRT